MSQSFNHKVDNHTRILILGSMPGIKSLKEQEYYAHPRNLFWPFMQALFGVDRTLAYEQRVQALNAVGVGLWDVYQQCFRLGSLDASIEKHSVIINDFDNLLRDFPGIEVIAMNGQAAWKTFSKQVVTPEAHAGYLKDKKLLSLPSTSPANASMDYEKKLSFWQVLTQT